MNQYKVSELCDKFPLSEMLDPRCTKEHCRFWRVKTKTCVHPSDEYYQNGENHEYKLKEGFYND